MTVESHRRRVLIADDHQAMLDTLVHLLSRDFDVVATVNDGLAAVTQAEQLEPDLLVLDIAMPVLNGIAAATRLYSLAAHGPRSCSSPICAAASSSSDRSLALGQVGFVVKDRLVVDLLPAIHQVFAGEHSSRRLRSLFSLRTQ